MFSLPWKSKRYESWTSSSASHAEPQHQGVQVGHCDMFWLLGANRPGKNHISSTYFSHWVWNTPHLFVTIGKLGKWCRLIRGSLTSKGSWSRALVTENEPSTGHILAAILWAGSHPKHSMCVPTTHPLFTLLFVAQKSLHFQGFSWQVASK